MKQLHKIRVKVWIWRIPSPFFIVITKMTFDVIVRRWFLSPVWWAGELPIFFWNQFTIQFGLVSLARLILCHLTVTISHSLRWSLSSNSATGSCKELFVPFCIVLLYMDITVRVKGVLNKMAFQKSWDTQTTIKCVPDYMPCCSIWTLLLKSLFVDTLLLPVPTTLCSAKEHDMKRALYELRNKLNYLSRILIHLKGQSRIYTSINKFHSFQNNILM